MADKVSLFDRPFWVEPAERGSFILNIGSPGGMTIFHNGESFVN